MSIEAPQPEPIPFRELVDTVHQPARLGILTALNECNKADFSYLKRLLELSDGNLGRHLEVLADAELVDVTKEFSGRRPRTWVSITRKGKTALGLQMQAMRSMVARFDTPTGSH